ncbi:MAG: group II truncated hemoglobin [Kofleriaceae bacterium]
MTTVDEAPFERLGGEAGVRRLVDHFYDRMDQRPDCAPIRAMHPADLASSRDKLAWFLTGWLGGPPVYVQRFGHPRLRARHLPFAIDDAARDQWMSCMREALAATITADEPLRAHLELTLSRLADHMRNRP